MEARLEGRSYLTGKKLVLFGGTFSVLTIFTITFGFRTLGWTRFQANSHLQEGRSQVIYLSRAVMACTEKTGKLPETSPEVPATLAQVGAKTYKSTAADWSAPAFSCEQFTIDQPQRFQYQWDKTDANDGVVRAKADFNADGTAEAVFEQKILCGVKDGRYQCHPGPFLDHAK